MSDITYELAHEFFNYDPLTGEMTWKKGRPCGKGINRSYAGKAAGYKGLSGSQKITYTAVEFRGKPYYVHRLAWLMTYGKMPDNVIDHIDGNGQNNRISNLRDVSKGTNRRNAPTLQVNNTTGFNGVSWDDKLKKYRAVLVTDGMHHWLGRHDTAEEAAMARRRKEIEMFGEYRDPAGFVVKVDKDNVNLNDLLSIFKKK